MIARLVLAVVMACVTGLVCVLVGAILGSVGIPIAVTIGAFLVRWGWILGVLAGVWFFFTGRTSLTL
ncbi:MAG: hypothetical protein ACYDCL_21480 [Myxococcales bacterium]